MFKEYCKTCLPSNHTIFCTFHGEERFKLFKIYYVVIILISLKEQCYLHLWWYFFYLRQYVVVAKLLKRWNIGSQLKFPFKGGYCLPSSDWLDILVRSLRCDFDNLQLNYNLLKDSFQKEKISNHFSAFIEFVLSNILFLDRSAFYPAHLTVVPNFIFLVVNTGLPIFNTNRDTNFLKVSNVLSSTFSSDANFF